MLKEPITVTDTEFEEKVKNNELPVVVDFWAPWCGPCKMMAPVLNNLAEEASDSMTIAKVNVDNQQHLSQKYKIRNIPTLVMFKEGKEINRYMGIKTKKFLMHEINKNFNGLHA